MGRYSIRSEAKMGSVQLLFC